MNQKIQQKIAVLLNIHTHLFYIRENDNLGKHRLVPITSSMMGRVWKAGLTLKQKFQLISSGAAEPRQQRGHYTAKARVSTYKR